VGVAGMIAATAGLAWVGAQALQGELRLTPRRAAKRLAPEA
jgi:hypothetical protein